MTLERLEWAASVGLDLSPGDPVAAWAVVEIRLLRSLVATAIALVEEDWAGTSADSRGQLWLGSARATLDLRSVPTVEHMETWYCQCGAANNTTRCSNCKRTIEQG